MDTNEFLAHYGVKGMKWGQHQTTFNKSEIKTARKNVKANLKSIQEVDKQIDLAIAKGDKAGAKKLLKQQVDLVKTNNLSDDVRASYQMTAGEKFAKAMFVGIMPTYGSVMDKRSRNDEQWEEAKKAAADRVELYENSRIGQISKIKK